MTHSARPTFYDVIIIGGGPAGIAAALELKKLGISRTLILEREGMVGGATRHCGHPPFGLREFKQFLTGPNYAKKLAEQQQVHDRRYQKGIEEAKRSVKEKERRESEKLISEADTHVASSRSDSWAISSPPS